MNWQMRSAYVKVKCQPGKTDQIWKKVQDWKHLIGAWVVDGEWDLLVWYDASDWKESYKWAKELRGWDAVERTSTHWVVEGGKGANWWWNGHAGAWVWARWPGKADDDSLAKSNWVWSWASVPGDWDAVAWLHGDSWEQVWDHAEHLKSKGWETEVMVPLKAYWNKAWEKQWWQS
ncbi:MAG TPA: Lrp/AsnC ligand binding domain-containing protein [Myxococcales bacterium]|nr:Lrp/AsnC ligand binding domain-containing protein [Myxococcales bacterium]